MSLMGRERIELLSPVGSYECLQAAIAAGADAVYFGVEQLNMRARSANYFSIQDIGEISNKCKINNVKTYITLNTLMYEHDMSLVKKILAEVAHHHLDAVIASDFAVIKHARALGIPLHISTQANVSNLDSAIYFSGFADGIVLARELTMKQVEHICKEIKRKQIKGVSGELLKIEIFVHGALCMAISGKCYLSLHAHNASANRGSCMQNCRRSYLVKDTTTDEEWLIDNEYIMSPKDLSTIDFLDRIVHTGANVFKIEGRTKGPDYVYTVTKCYREALQSIEEGNYTHEKIEYWKQELSKVYNRGFWGGYYLGNKLGEWTSHPHSAAVEKKVYVGKGLKYYPKIKVGEYLMEAGSVKVGDTLMFTGPNVGMIKEKLKVLIVNGIRSELATVGDRITYPVNERVTRQDRLYKVIVSKDE